jgi:cytochrome c peroxidase
MYVRPWPLMATLGVALLTACDDSGNGGHDPADDGGTTESDENGTGPADTGEATTGTSGASNDGADGSSSAADSGSGDASSDGSSSTGEPSDGYPADVLDHLELPWPPYDYDDELPDHWQTPGVAAFDNTPASNPGTAAGATLGRVLFYDVTLSANDTIACATCHAQATGFSDPDQFSVGFEGGLTGRNSMGLSDARFYQNGHFFWDERADTLEDQVLMPIQNEVEMGLTLEELVERVQARPYYPFLFEQAFGDPAIDEERISLALAQFVRAIVSYRAPYDEGIEAAGNPGADFPNYTAQENQGKAIFFGPAGRCAPCHLGQPGPPPPPGAPLPNTAVFFMTAPANNGLDAQTGIDDGVGAITGDPAQDGLFKSPSLRNVELTAPYMHDGRFDTLEEVVEHYDNGVEAHPNLDPRLRMPGGQPQQLNLSDAQKAALVAFLRTLTDEALGEDVRFGDPFRQ